MSNELKKSPVERFYNDTQKEFNGEFGIDPFQEEDELSKGALQINDVLVYDLQSAPKDCGMDMEKIIFLFRTEKIILYDSYYGGHIPHIIKASEDIEIQIVDVQTNKGKEIVKKYKDEKSI